MLHRGGKSNCRDLGHLVPLVVPAKVRAICIPASFQSAANSVGCVLKLRFSSSPSWRTHSGCAPSTFGIGEIAFSGAIGAPQNTKQKALMLYPPRNENELRDPKSTLAGIKVNTWRDREATDSRMHIEVRPLCLQMIMKRQ
jgi:hypothetical protein